MSIRCLRKAESDARAERIEKVMLAEPELTNNQLCERFGCSRSIITKLRKKLNVETPDSFDLIKRKDANAAMRKIGLADTQEEHRRKMKARENFRVQTAMRDKEQGNDYISPDS